MNTDPIMLVIGISKATGVEKDTAKNLKETKEATVNIISEWFVEAANYASAGVPHEVSEWPYTGLTQTPSDIVKPSLVGESAFSVECVVNEVVPFKSKRVADRVSGELFILEGIRIHAREDIMDENYSKVDISKLKPVARLGGTNYTTIATRFDIPRPTVTE